MAPILDPVTDATNEWTNLVQQEIQLDLSRLKAEEASTVVRAQLTAGRTLLTTASRGTTAIRLIDHPRECLEMHIRMTEVLQLTEQAFGEHVAWMELALRTGQVDHDRRMRANRLAAEADRVKLEALR